MPFPAKPSLDEVRSFLARHRALVVHCSGTPKGIGPGQEHYPDDLQHVWLGRAQGGISCSVVKPGDRFHGAGRSSTGSVGLVVAATNSKSIVAVAPRDAGSWVENGVRVVDQEVDIGVTDLEQSFTARSNGYNEWVVRDFKVIGLFVAEPATTWQDVPMLMSTDMPPQLTPQDVSISVSKVAEDFKGLPIYGLSKDEILQWTVSGWCPAAHSDIYRAVHEENYQAVVRQHVLPAASIQRFFSSGNSCVEVFLRPKEKSFRQGTSWGGFVEIRKWDEQIEKGVNVLEAAFQDLAERIVAGQDALTPEESLVVAQFWAVISERSRARRTSLISGSMFESVIPSPLPQAHLDLLERQGIFMAGTTEQIDRAVYGMTQAMAILQTQRKSSSWRVVRASEGQFLVSDNYHHDQLVPISPTTYLQPGIGTLTLDRAAVENFNESLLAASEQYVFALSLSECGVGIDVPPRD